MRGAFTGAADRARRPLRSRRRRHAVSGRVGLHQSGVSGQPAARVAERRSAARRLHAVAAGQRAGDRRQQRAAARPGGRRQLPLRPVLSPERAVSIELPPLRARAGDVELLTAHFLQQFRDRPISRRCTLPAKPAAALAAHDFPGNVRELENALRRAVALSSGGLITIDCLPPEIAGARRESRGRRRASSTA